MLACVKKGILSSIKGRDGFRFVSGGSQSVVVICRSTYELGGVGGEETTHVSFYLQKG